MSSSKLICSKIYLELKLSNFTTNNLGENFESPWFTFLNSKWRLDILLNSITNYDWIRITLIRELTDNIDTIDFTVGIKDSKPAIKFDLKRMTFKSLSNIWYAHFDKPPEVIKEYIKYKRTLTIYFEASNAFEPVCNDMGSQCSILFNTTALSDDFHGLLLSERDSDVTINVQGCIFKVHKIILKSRSPVFSTMFEHDTLEKNGGLVKIEDCDPETFRCFLQCMYTGRVDNVLPDMAISVCRIADKYQLTDIKEKCSDIMKKGLSADTACEVMILADIINDMELKKLAEDFLITNMETVLKSSKWTPFSTANSMLAAQILEKAFNKAFVHK